MMAQIQQAKTLKANNHQLYDEARELREQVAALTNEQNGAIAQAEEAQRKATTLEEDKASLRDGPKDTDEVIVNFDND